MPTHSFRRAVAFTATAAAVCALALSSATAASAAIVPVPITRSADGAALALSPIGTFESGVFDESAAEIVQTYRDRIFVVNAQAGSVSVLDNADPTKPVEQFALTSEGVANSLAIRDDGLGVIAFEAPVKTDPGHVVFFDANAADAASAILGEITVGALPDMVTISKDGAYAVVANEGEPADDFTTDPEGSVGVIKLPSTVSLPATADAKTANFRAFEPGGTKTLDPKVRIFGPDVAAAGQDPTTLSTNRVSRNLEPEYVTVSGTTAYVALQEANAIAVVDLTKPEVTKILPLGFKDYAKNTLDASDRDPEGAPTYNQKSYAGLFGMYMPDGISSYVAADGRTYLVTANEGDGREWGDYDETARVKDLGKKGLAPVCATSPLASKLGDADLGRLNVTTSMGLNADGTCYSELYTFGGRSFSVWSTDGVLVFDSGSQFEQVTHDANPAFFNSNHTENNLEGRSDDKGPEPENLVVGVVDGRTYAFVGLERVGGVMVYDITTASAPTFVTYVNNRDVTKTPGTPAAGDLGPEGLAFTSALRSPTGTPLLTIGNEVSGTTTTFEVDSLLSDDAQPDVQVLTINDFHGRIVQEASNGYAGAAALTGAVDAYRAQNPNTLFVSAGDNIGASAFESFIQDDQPTLDALKAAKLDVSAVGNHEFDQGFDDIQRVIDTLGGPQYALGANVYEKGTDTPALEEYTVETTESGARIAFIGVVTPQTQTLVNPAGIADIEFGDMGEAVDRVTAEIVAADAADVVVVLAHDGGASSSIEALQADTTSDFGRLVHNLPADVDAVVSGHTHQTYAGEVDGVPVVQANQYGTRLGTLDIDLDADNTLVSIEPGLVTLFDAPVSMSAAYPNLEVNEVVAEAKAEADILGREQVGTITESINRAKTPAGAEDRGAHSTLGNTVADVYLWATSENPEYGGTDAQIAFMNPGGLRADLVPGENGAVTYRAVANVQPFGNTLVTLELTAAQLKAVLEEQWQPASSSRPKLALGVSEGFSFEYLETAERGSHIGAITLNGEELDVKDTATTYKIVTNSFLAAGGDNFTTFAQGTRAADSGQIDLAATVNFFEAADGPVAPSPADRAVLVTSIDPVGPTDPGTSPELPGTGPDTTPPAPTNPGGTPPAAGTQVGGDWADVTLSNGGRIEQGRTLTVTVSGLKPGQQIAATLFSQPLVVTGIPAASAQGVTTFAVAIPADFDLGAHRLVVTSAGLADISVGVTVVAPGALAATGAELPWGIAFGAGFLLIAGGLAFALRKRRTVVG
ncbi:bifunctional metallophosphatase/5'-nucleotidase [Microbacterium sp. Gd 4-13]|uniref:choice-of-anchor I family protein n=1 Tax=Microbacterium sp. Gd 4-13 TaxID=2173179 RepID=UPI000D57CD54|nr:choice-of-anchor I family protein [Microbacterium sp. Gd 4-13]PVW03918.1 bifunctional metallophosphatase/5'-nucleotidase [Microbacterium sp. Gd 4-13]